MESIAGLAGTALGDPVYGLIAAILAVGTIIAWMAHKATQEKRSGDPLDNLFVRSVLKRQLETVARRPAPTLRKPVPLHGQRAQMARLSEIWQRETREETVEEIARVMRASKDACRAPVHILGEVSPIAESEWEEVKLLPAPASAQTRAA